MRYLYPLLATKRFTQAVIGPEAFMTEVSRPDTHKYITEGFVRNERLQYYVDTVRQETNKQIARLAGLESFDLFPEVVLTSHRSYLVTNFTRY